MRLIDDRFAFSFLAHGYGGYARVNPWSTQQCTIPVATQSSSRGEILLRGCVQNRICIRRGHWEREVVRASKEWVAYTCGGLLLEEELTFVSPTSKVTTQVVRIVVA
jgi:hypothetical protein